MVNRHTIPIPTKPKTRPIQPPKLIQRIILIIKQTLMWLAQPKRSLHTRHLTSLALRTTPQVFATLTARNHQHLRHFATATLTLIHQPTLTNLIFVFFTLADDKSRIEVV
jgi:hypothetical protein